MSELLKKYESIDQSKLNEATIKILNRVKTITTDFTADDEKNNKIAEQVLNEVMKKNPDAVKIVKRTPKAKPAPKKVHKASHTAKGLHKTTSTATAKTSNNNIMSVAKEIQKSGESWKEAMERAKVVLKERREQVVQKQKTELEKLFNIVKTKKELQGFANSDIRRDSVRDAKPRGARFVSKEGSTSNAYGTFPNKIGRKYWETRDRHADRLAPNYPKDMPLLERGGELKGNFLAEIKVPYNYEKVVEDKFEFTEFLSKTLTKKWFGNGIWGVKMVKPLFERDYSQRILVEIDIPLGVTQGSGLDKFEVGEFISKTLTKKWFGNGIWGVDIISNFANGGSLPFMTDPNFGNFQNTGAFADGGSIIGDTVSAIFNSNEKDGKIKTLFGYKTKTGLFEMMTSVNNDPEEITSAIFIPNAKKGRIYTEWGAMTKEGLFEMINNMRNTFELGGAFMMTDLAGHTGGSDGLGNPTPLNGVSGTYYTGQVGETGALSSGELFEAGGVMAQNQQVINDASQSYVNYYLNDGGGVFKDGGSIPNNYEGRTPADVWENWTQAQRSHFLLDHSELLDKDRMDNNLGYTRTVQKDKKFTELTPLTKRVLEAHVTSGQYASGGSLGKSLYVAYSSYFDSNKYDEEKIISALKSIGAKNIHLENDGGMSNQPEVVVFNGSKNKAEDALNEAFETDYILVYEKDWRTKKMADGGKTASNKKVSSIADYVPNRDVKELSVVLKGQLKQIKGSDILDGVYVRKTVKGTNISNADAVFAKMLKDAKEAKRGKSKRFDASELKMLNLEMVKKLLDAGYTEQQIRNVIFGYTFDNKVLAEGEFDAQSGIFGYEDSYVPKKIDSLVEAQKNNEFAVGIEYPDFDWQGIIKKYKISSKPKELVIERRAGSWGHTEYFYEVFVGENIVIGHNYGYKDFDSDGKLKNDYIDKTKKVTDPTKQNAWQKEREVKAGFNSGWWTVVSSKIEVIDDVIKTLVSQKDGYCKELDFYNDSLPKTLKENKIAFADGGNVGSGFDPVKVKVVLAVGIDEAIKFYDAEYPIRPYQLLERALRGGYITLDEINERVVDSAMETAQDSEDMDEVGSSDFGAYLRDFLDEAGFKVGYVNGRLTREYADGGVFDDNEGFMRADNERSFRYPEREVHVDTIDEPIDLTSNVTLRSNRVAISPINENIDLSDDNRVRARMTQSNRGSAESFSKVNPRAFEFIDLPTPISNKHKND